MDRNAITGLVLMTLLTIVYFTYFAPKPPPPKENTSTESQTEQVEEAPVPVIAAPAEKIKTVVKPNMDYFVTVNKLNVRSYPRANAPIRSSLRKGMPLKALEIKGDWVRISDYEVHDSGNDVADWVHSDFLSHEKPVVTAQEVRKALVALVKKSDDFMLYEEQFIIATKQLLDQKTCTHDDFELIDGWILSRTFNIEPVYFVYCGGTARENKVYMNPETGEIFQP